MNVALQDKNVYEDFEPRTDSLYFKVGTHGLISFHGRNYNIKKRMSSEERARLMADNSFFRVAPDCYVNVGKIADMEDDCLLFEDTSKRVICPKRKQHDLRRMMGIH